MSLHSLGRASAFGMSLTLAWLAPQGVEAQEASPASSPAQNALSPQEKALLARLCGVATPPAMEPLSAQIVGEGDGYYRPLIRHEWGERCMRVEFPLSVNLTGELVSSIPVDRDLAEVEGGATLRPRLRIGGRFTTAASWLPTLLHVEYEHDVITGILGSDQTLEGEGYPSPRDIDHELRKGFARLSLGKYLHMSAGWQTSHWGLGLLANDGAHGWTPGSGRFSNPISGDRALRAQLATGPHTPANLLVVIGGDLLDGDFLADDDVLLEGDTAQQAVAAIVLGQDKKHGGGLYGALRHQEAPDGSATDVAAFDLHLRTEYGDHDLGFAFESEAALVTGTTELAPNTDFPEHDVLQFGAAARAQLFAGMVSSIVDFLYASGDNNLDDADQNAFRPDPNYEMGLFLFRQVLAAQSARGSFRAGDPGLVGFPAEDLDRIPTRGSPSNTIAVFPRLAVRPADGLEAYGGPLFAFAAQDALDPFNTRIGGGTPRNALGGTSSRFLGTELDLGVRYRLHIHGVEATLGAEGGVFRPSSGFVQSDDEVMKPVGGGRLMLDARL